MSVKGSKRKKIRNEVVDLLKRHNIVKPSSIRASRSLVYEAAELPAISVYTRADELEERSEAPREMRRRLTLALEILVRDDKDEEASNKLDDLIEKIEHVLTNDDTIDCSADDLLLRRIDFDYEGENFDKPIHSATMNWEVKYRDFYPRDNSLRTLHDLATIHADWDFAEPGDGPDDVIEASDDVPIPTT